MTVPELLRITHLDTELRTRRCAVPGRMVEEATRLRLAGDWAGACAAAGIDVDETLLWRATETGAEARVADDLRHLVPDLVRWHLFRRRRQPGRAALRDPVVLATYPRPGGAERSRLCVTPPDRGGPGPLRLSLDVRRTADGWRREHRLDRMCWDARAVGELRLRCGDATRTACFHPDGRPLSADELPASPDGLDPLRRLEWATLRWDAGDVEAAAAVYGLETIDARPDWHQYPVALDRTAEQARDWWETAPDSAALVLTRWADWSAMEVRRGRRGPALADYREEHSGRTTGMAPGQWQRLPDWDLVRLGLLRPDELHPLVHRALFPLAPPIPPYTWSPDLSPVTIACSGRRHEVSMVGGRLRFGHDEADLDREEALAALGGPRQGCAAAGRAWHGDGTLPPELHRWRQYPFDLAFHGNLAGLEALLDAGFDPHVRAEDGRGLLDHAHHLPAAARRRLGSRLA
ncbi:hypothetical protein ABZS66_53285 [Dactylosporangium sp. NPDC005572]|uniref:hypothetical protein n=1 Tax=Dactylosporangium sp. NPDC005572 TaxID=3156889 RepID=UPI0033B1818A